MKGKIKILITFTILFSFITGNDPAVQVAIKHLNSCLCQPYPMSHRLNQQQDITTLYLKSRKITTLMTLNDRLTTKTRTTPNPRILRIMTWKDTNLLMTHRMQIPTTRVRQAILEMFTTRSRNFKSMTTTMLATRTRDH